MEFNVNDDLLWVAVGLIAGIVIALVAVRVNPPRRGDVRRYPTTGPR
jgi:hypothetical protein